MNRTRIPAMATGFFALSLAAALLLAAPAAFGNEVTTAAAGLPASADRADRISVGPCEFLRVEIRANTFTSSDQSSVALAFDAAGGLVAAWDSRRQQEGGYGVYSQRFSPAGKRIGGETACNLYRTSAQWRPAAAFDRSGRCWIGWDSFGQDGSGFGCYLRPFDAGLGAGGPEIRLNSETAGDQCGLVLAPAADGGIIAAWTAHEGGARRTKAQFCVLDGEGNPTAAPALIDPESDRSEVVLALAALDGGGFVAVWSAFGPDRLPAGIHARLFGADGKPLGKAFQINSQDDKGSIEPCVAALPGGGFVAVWMQSRSDCGDYDVAARRFGQDGRPLAPAFIAAEAAGAAQSGATVAAAADGRFCIAWNRTADGPQGADVMARLFESGGEPAGPAFRATLCADGDQSLLAAAGKPAAAFGPDGQLAFAWSGASDLGDRKAANVTLLLPAGAGQPGDLNADGACDAADLDVFYAETPAGEIAAAAAKARLAANEEELAEAAALLASAEDDAEQSGSDSAGGPPAIASVADAAEPHEPPIRDPSTRTLLPYGGDEEPFSSRADEGFVGVTNTGWTPPDPHLAAGPNHVVAMTNGAIAFLTKDGTLLFQDELEDSYGFWGGVGATWFVFDPEVIYDPHSDRFMAMACERGSNNHSYFLLAVSDDSDPTGQWYKYRLDVTSLAGNDIDSPNIAVNDSVVCLTADFFTPTQKYLVYFIDKADLLVGGIALDTNHLLITGTQSHGVPVIYGSAPGFYMIEHFEASSNSTVRLHAITDPLGAAQHQTYTLAVPSYGPPADANQMGSSVKMETFDARFWSCVYRDGSLWAAHHQGSPYAKARWYEIDMAQWPVSGTPSLVQSGDVDGGSNVHTFFNSISVDAHGNALMCFALSSSSTYISMARAFRAAGDAPGTMQPFEIVKPSAGPYTYGRWGDYSAVVVDPADDATFWYHHEYATTTTSWNTWIAKKVVAAPPVPDIKINGLDDAGSLPYPSNLNVTIHLDPGDADGNPSDWWVFVEKDAAKTWWCSYKQGWKKSFIRFTGATLRDVAGYSVYNAEVPVGSYVFTFALDEKDNLYQGTYSDTATVDIF